MNNYKFIPIAVLILGSVYVFVEHRKCNKEYYKEINQPKLWNSECDVHAIDVIKNDNYEVKFLLMFKNYNNKWIEFDKYPEYYSVTRSQNVRSVACNYRENMIDSLNFGIGYQMSDAEIYETYEKCVYNFYEKLVWKTLIIIGGCVVAYIVHKCSLLCMNREKYKPPSYNYVVNQRTKSKNG